jgi:hypothetical protein
MALALTQLRHGNQVERLQTVKKWKGLSIKRKLTGDSQGSTVPWHVLELQRGKHLTQKSPFFKK